VGRFHSISSYRHVVTLVSEQIIPWSVFFGAPCATETGNEERAYCPVRMLCGCGD